ncbi:Serine/threonine-protein kinase ENV7 [Candida viswanathii]|uniref:non-specific serine/threonine protein kinase n=1 Tax=Candida viswanathii TaxID=5486 RepID=A0A367XSC0_9ASCO|nr:Serine/threonine-protein kinase ENV7 [Candida viswanathii]
MDLLLSLCGLCLPCFPTLSSPSITINNHNYKIIKLLGEGGFSYVYLVSTKTQSSQSYYALKKIRCPYGVQDEKHIDLASIFEKSLQDIINELVLNNAKMDQAEILRIFIGVCRGLKDVLLPASEDDDFEEPNGNDNSLQMQELVPYAHHDLKPANVMLSAEGLPFFVTWDRQALTVQDFAQEHCTLPYRAPELVDVATNTEITEKTDIWSLGCLLYCCCFGYSPFEKLEIEQGANLNLAILQGKYQIPRDNGDYDPKLIELIKKCLQLNQKVDLI